MALACTGLFTFWYLGLVRDYGALAIGEIMMVTGAAQLTMAPVATILERRVDVRWLMAAGYALLAIGFVGNGFMTLRDRFLGVVLAAGSAWLSNYVMRGC